VVVQPLLEWMSFAPLLDLPIKNINLIKDLSFWYWYFLLAKNFRIENSYPKIIF
jgi:hypothetical protein